MYNPFLRFIRVLGHFMHIYDHISKANNVRMRNFYLLVSSVFVTKKTLNASSSTHVGVDLGYEECQVAF